MQAGTLVIFLGGLLVGGMSLMPGKAGATDFYNVNVKVDWTNEVFSRSADFYGGHFDWVEGKYLQAANLNPDPSGYTKIVAYTGVEDSPAGVDYRESESLEDYLINVRYMSDQKMFEGRSQVKFNFDTGENGEFINPQMFYWGEFILPAEFHTNGVQQVDKKAMLSNFDANRDVDFNVDGIEAQHDDDFAQFNIHRTWNSLYFSDTDHATVTASDLHDQSAVTNAQRFTYDEMKAIKLDVDAGSGHHLLSLQIVRQDITTGDFVTNAVAFSEQPGEYTHAFSTNLLNVVGSNTVQNIQTAESITLAGTPYIWYMNRGVAEDIETIDTTDFNNDGYTGHQKFLMNVDDLYDDTDYFKTIGLTMTNGLPSFTIPHSKTDRRYRIKGTPTLSPADWTSRTNALGTGGILILELPDEPEPIQFFRGSVELP